MPAMRVIYIAGFNLDKNSGRNKATREKTNALKGLHEPDCFRLYYPGRSASRFIAYVKVLFFDILMLYRLFSVDQNTRIVQRTTFLPLTNIWLKLRGVPIIYELHTDFQDEIQYYHVSVVEKLILYTYVFAEKLNIQLASRIIYNHPVLKHIMETGNALPRNSVSGGELPHINDAAPGKGSIYRKPSIYTYNGCDPDKFFPMDRLHCRIALGLDPNMKYYLFIGSLSKWRGVDLLIDIFKKSMSANEILFILGNSSHDYGTELKSLAAGAGNIIFHDEVRDALVPEYINASDICLVPVKPILKSPGNPLKLYDYIACGKPVIGQENVVGCSDEIIKYGVGMVTDFYNVERAAHDLKLFCASHDPKYYTSHNREVALLYVSWKKRMEEWMELLKY